ncbi:MAG: homoserine kinase [Candidatus Methanodesulfokora sp.]
MGGNGNPVVRRVCVRAPASIANLGAGFDVLAMAIEGFYDEVKVSISEGNGHVEVESTGFNIPSRGNLACAIAEEFLNRYKIDGIDVKIVLHKGIPPARGLGSSGASCVATLYALSRIFSINLSLSEFLELAGLCESFVAGSQHYDNVSASTLGGVVIVDRVRLGAYKIVPPVDIHVAVLMPSEEFVSRYPRKTAFARDILPKQVDFRTLVDQNSAVAKLVYALMSGNLEVLGEAVSTDFVAEPRRSTLIPLYWELKRAALENGALGFNIAGAGPSVFALCRSIEDATRVSEALRGIAERNGIETEAIVTQIAREGVRIVECS